MLWCEGAIGVRGSRNTGVVLESPRVDWCDSPQQRDPTGRLSRTALQGQGMAMRLIWLLHCSCDLAVKTMRLLICCSTATLDSAPSHWQRCMPSESLERSLGGRSAGVSRVPKTPIPFPSRPFARWPSGPRRRCHGPISVQHTRRMTGEGIDCSCPALAENELIITYLLRCWWQRNLPKR